MQGSQTVRIGTSATKPEAAVAQGVGVSTFGQKMYKNEYIPGT